MSTETISLIRDGEKVGGGGGGGGGHWGGVRDMIYTIATHCHHQNGSCIKVDSDESHFNIS